MVTLRDIHRSRLRPRASVLLELAHLLGQYRPYVVVVGGWVPELLFPEAELVHVGSLDVDLALNHRGLDDAGYRTIHQLLIDVGIIRKKAANPFNTSAECRSGMGGKSSWKLTFWQASMAGEGAEAALNGSPACSRGEREGAILPLKVIPRCGWKDAFRPVRDCATICVAGVPMFVIMKAMALGSRMKEKDAWDIYFCLLSYPVGRSSLPSDSGLSFENRLVREGLRIIQESFYRLTVMVRQPWRLSKISLILKSAPFVNTIFERVQDLLKKTRSGMNPRKEISV